jgi:hypothetical protein
MKKILQVLILIWTLPQNLLGLALVIIYRMPLKARYKYAYIFDKFPQEGISLGFFILFDDYETQVGIDDIKHEYGHFIQNLILGPFYIIVGIFSELNYRFRFSKFYYDFWTEKWADKLGGVKRRKWE